MALDIQKFLSEIGAGVLSDDERAVAAGLFDKHPELGIRIETQITDGQTDLMKRANELQDKQARLELEWETLANIRSDDDDAIKAAEKRVEDLSIQQVQLQNRFRQVAKDAGVDADAVLKEIGVTADAAKPASKVDSPAVGFDPAAYDRQQGLKIWNAAKATLEVADLADEHLALFGKPLKRAELLDKLSEEVKRTGNQALGVRDIWAKEYHVAAKLDEQNEARIQARIAEAVDKATRAATDAAVLRGGDQFRPETAIGRSPVLETLASENKDQDNAPQRVNGVPDTVRASILTFRKLRQDAAKTA